MSTSPDSPVPIEAISKLAAGDTRGGLRALAERIKDAGLIVVEDLPHGRRAIAYRRPRPWNPRRADAIGVEGEGEQISIAADLESAAERDAISQVVMTLLGAQAHFLEGHP